MQNLYQISLVTHIVGLVMMAGGTLVSFLLVQQFWKQYEVDKVRAAVVMESVGKIASLLSLGMLVLIVSGVTMMVVVKGAYGQQTWMKIKLALVVIAILNGVLVGRRQGMKVIKSLAEERNGISMGDRLIKLRSTTRWFYISQLLIFAVIFTLAVFKFN